MSASIQAKSPVPVNDFKEFQLAMRAQIAAKRSPAAMLPNNVAPMINRRRLVSVIVLNYNGARILPRCIKQLLNQTHSQLEIIIVDNGSDDASLSVLEQFAVNPCVTVVANGKNLGVAGGRNSGVAHAKGEVIAFIDNDGYADSQWIENGLQSLYSDASVGAVAPLVLFEKNKLVLNGAGGCGNILGFAGDNCFSEPYEFAEIPREVLYPMGCGMMLKRELADAIFPIDRLMFKWFDDTEIGLRTWSKGYRVVVAETSRVDHDFHTSDAAIPVPDWKRALMFERARMRQVLKYLPLTLLPGWLNSELQTIGKAALRGNFRRLGLAAAAWLWNLLHLPSALGIRGKFALPRGLAQKILRQEHKITRQEYTADRAMLPDFNFLSREIAIDGKSELSALHYGWFAAEQSGTYSFRRAAEYSSVFFELPALSRSINLWCSPVEGALSGKISIRELGTLNFFHEVPFEIQGPGWRELSLPRLISPGRYEMIMHLSSAGRRPQLAVSKISFN